MSYQSDDSNDKLLLISSYREYHNMNQKYVYIAFLKVKHEITVATEGKTRLTNRSQ
jgi:hypothetical protein